MRACVQIVEGLFINDPEGAMLAFGDMMKKQITMPAHMMNDGEHEAKNKRNLFAVSPGHRPRSVLHLGGNFGNCKTSGISLILGGPPTILYNILNDSNWQKSPPNNSTVPGHTEGAMKRP